MSDFGAKKCVLYTRRYGMSGMPSQGTTYCQTLPMRKVLPGLSNFELGTRLFRKVLDVHDH